MSKLFTVLLDPSNNWLHCLVEEDLPEFESLGYKSRVIWSTDQIQEGDILFVLGFTRLIPEVSLRKNKFNFVIHESNLPDGRGFSPVAWQVLSGRSIIPVVAFSPTSDFDRGEIFCRDEIILEGHELYEEIRQKQYSATKRLLSRLLADYPHYKPRPQAPGGSTYPRRKPSDQELNLNDSIESQFNVLRTANNALCPAYFIRGGIKYIIKIEKFDEKF